MSGGEYPISLARVVSAVRDAVLSANHKRVWRDVFELSRRPEGCTVSAAALARRLGMESAKTVETLRWELEQFGLLRRPPGRRAWYAAVPGDVVPSPTAQDGEIFACAARLEAFLAPAVTRRLARFGGDRTPESTGIGVPRGIPESTGPTGGNPGEGPDPPTPEISGVPVLTEGGSDDPARAGGSEEVNLPPSPSPEGEADALAPARSEAQRATQAAVPPDADPLTAALQRRFVEKRRQIAAAAGSLDPDVEARAALQEGA